MSLDWAGVGNLGFDHTRAEYRTNNGIIGKNNGAMGDRNTNAVGTKLIQNWGKNETRPRNAYVNYIIKY